MSVADDIRMALHDAIGWQSGLADAWGRRTPEGREALATVKRYKAILRRRYGSDLTMGDDMLTNARTVTLDELRAKPPETK